MGEDQEHFRVSSVQTDAGRVTALADVPAREVRTDIQGLRALAVGLVLLFHLWPQVLRGGYVGVDVFFVISGFLITSHLLRDPPRSIGGFAAFWGRRLRRLLPASLLVIVVTILVGTFVLPANQLANLARDGLSSVLYVENWTLAVNAVDYLGSTQAPSPFQHYWSLGVEEQFYLLWPFVVAGGVWLVGRAVRSRTVGAAVAMGGFGLVSLVFSITWTASDPAFAYFATPTRLWELAAGGAIALLPLTGWFARIPAVARVSAAWGGLVLIVVTAFVYTEATPFPGFAAVVPVGGACLLIAGRSDVLRWSPGSLLAMRPVQFLGDTSYAIYLWHFPLIVLGTAALGVLSLPTKLVVIVASVALAHATRLLVEDPVRRSRWLRERVRRTYIAAIAITAVTIAVTVVPQLQVQRLVVAQQEQQQQNDIINSGCVGAAALANSCELRGAGVTPDPAVAANDRSTAYAKGCLAERPFPDVVTCDFGVPNGANRVALVGNSHAVQWLPALEKLAPELDLAITTFVASRCAVSVAPQVFDTTAMTDGCARWGRDVVEATTTGDFDLIVVTAASDEGLVGVDPGDQFDAKVEGYATPLQEWATSGTQVLVLRDTPQPLVDVVGCVAMHATDPAQCDGDREAWLSPDPLAEAALQMNSDAVQVADLSQLMCGADRCYSVIGGVLVYFDPRHISGTFSESLAQFLRPSLQNALGLG